MSKNKEKAGSQSPRISEDALAALVRPSAPPTGAKKDSGDDGVLDLAALASSMPPPPSEPQAAAVPAAAEPVAASEGTVAPASVGAQPVAAQARATRAAAQPAVQQSGSRTGVWVATLLGLAVIGVVAWYLTRADEPQVVAQTVTGEGESTVEQAVEAARAEPTEPVETELGAPPAEAVDEPIEESQAEETTERVAVAEPAARRAADAVRRAPRPERSRSALAQPEPEADESPAAAAVAAAPREPVTRMSASGGGLDSVLDQALGGRPARGGTQTVPTMAEVAMETPRADLPQTPSRADVARSLGRLLPGIRQCAGEQVGLANASIMVRNDGSVGSVAVGGSPFGGTPQGRCMEGVIRRAQFPRFKQTTFRITYPFAIRPRS